MAHKPKPYIIKHAEFYLPTQDDWYPNFIRNTVRVRVYETLSVRHTVLHYSARISVWGSDDLGMEKDFELSLVPSCRLKEIQEIVKEANNLPNPLNRDWLSAHGFKYA
jgi:hypothetical protein